MFIFEGICPKCGLEFKKEFPRKSEARKFKGFCSRTCANSRTWTEQQNQSRSKKVSDFYSHLTEEYILKFQRINSDPNKIQKTLETWKAKRDSIRFEDLSWAQKKKRILEEQENKCKQCGISKWRDQKLSLEIDHIDGNRENNSRSNLEAICPNCHSLTPTWRKSKKEHRDLFPEEKALELLASGLTPHGVVKTLGLRGSYYHQRVSKLKDFVIN